MPNNVRDHYFFNLLATLGFGFTRIAELSKILNGYLFASFVPLRDLTLRWLRLRHKSIVILIAEPANMARGDFAFGYIKKINPSGGS